jgi:putative transposase
MAKRRRGTIGAGWGAGVSARNSVPYEERRVPDYRRWFVPGGTFFFTVVTAGRAPILCGAKARESLRGAVRECRERWPFTIDAIVLLPDHVHTLWTLPHGDAEFSRRWAFLKQAFTRSWVEGGGAETWVGAGKEHQRRRGVWQPRFWEHMIRDENDFERHLEYILYNPVKHGLVTRVRDWPYSTFHRFVQRGEYPIDWGCQSGDFTDIEATARE